MAKLRSVHYSAAWAALPLLLTAFFTAVVAEPENLRYSIDDPWSLNIWVSAFVHNSVEDLIVDGVIYFLLTWYTLRIFHQQGWGWGFRRGVALIILVVPILSNVATLLSFKFFLNTNTGVTSGSFPSLLGGFVGLLFAGSVATIFDNYGVLEAVYTVLSIVLATLSIIAVFSEDIHVSYAILGFIGIFILWGDVIRNSEGSLLSRLKEAEELLPIGVGIITLTIITGMLFPTDWVRQDVYINIFGRFGGLLTGLSIGGILTLILIYREEIRRAYRCQQPAIWEWRTHSVMRLYSHRWWLLPVCALLIAAFLATGAKGSKVVAGATVFYASMLFIRELRDRPSVRCERFYFAKNQYDHRYRVEVELANTGEAEIEKGMAMVRLRDPATQQRTDWVKETEIHAIEGDIISHEFALAPARWLFEGSGSGKSILEYRFSAPKMRGELYKYKPLRQAVPEVPDRPERR